MRAYVRACVRADHCSVIRLDCVIQFTFTKLLT